MNGDRLNDHDAYQAQAAFSDDGMYRLNTRRVIPSYLRLAETPPACRGATCRQGRTECREACNPLPEMACAEPEPETDMSERRAVWIGLWCAVMFVGSAALVGYWFADSIAALLRRT